MESTSNYRNYLEFLPTIGILVFMGLYFYASTLYPGGSQNNVNSVGFDWVHNYWCNLMNLQGINGQPNPARPIAITGMVILCTSLALFFIQFANKVATVRSWKVIIKLFGIISMVLAVLIFTRYHDLMTTLSSVFGIFVVIGVIWEIYKSNMPYFKISGLLCILLLIVNNYVYYTQHGIEYLPLLQKLTFVFVLAWIVGINYKMTRKNG
ncbi:MAG: hypothetical protein AAFP76_09515 [Bacteroidota bacterium]